MHFKDTAWYRQRLEENKKPEPMTDLEKEQLGLQNKQLLAEAPRIIANALRRGWISFRPELERPHKITPVQAPNDQEIF